MPAAVPAGNFPTLLDVARLDKGSGYDVITEAIFSHQELTLFPVATQSETVLNVSVLAGLPGGSTFRRPNTGVQPSKPVFENKRFDMALVDRRVEVDKDGVYQRSKDKPRLLVNQSVPQMEKALADVCQQIIYGKLDDPNFGFPGLIYQYSPDAAHSLSCTGTANNSSVWLLDLRPSSCEVVFGADATLTMGDDWKEETVFIPPNNDRMVALTNRIAGWCGFRLLNKHRAIRISNIGIAANKTLTDVQMYAALLLADVLGWRPTHILGHARSFEQLRQSRITALNPAPDELTSWAGIPIVRSINISTNETF